VVVDEFCKELAAISLVKYHLYSAWGITQPRI
jgi:hypothetical protein